MRYFLGYAPNRTTMDAKPLGQRFRNSIRLVPAYNGPNLFDLGWGQLCHIASNLRGHVLRVVFAISQEQVIGINAGGRIAFVQYPQSIGNRPIVNRPRKSMRVFLTTWIATTKQTITHVVEPSGPDPTSMSGVGFQNLFPKTFDWITRFWHELNVAFLATKINTHAPFIRG